MSSTNIDESEESVQSDIFRNLVADSKIMFLRRAVEQYDQAQENLRRNEDYQQRLIQLLGYNRMKLLELDLARQSIFQSANSNSLNNMQIPMPKQANKLQGTIMPQVNTINSLTLQIPFQLPLQLTDEKARSNGSGKFGPSLENQSDSIVSSYTSQNNIGHTIETQEKETRDLDLQLRTSENAQYATLQKQHAMKGTTRTRVSEEQNMSPKNDIPSQPTATTDLECFPQNNEASANAYLIDDGFKLNLQYSLFDFRDADVLFQRGNFSYNNPGNKVYREYIKSLQDDYMRCERHNKHLITTQVFNHIKVTCQGRFLACDDEGSKKWEELSEDAARRKIGQSLREKNKRYMPPRKNSKCIFDCSDATQGSI